MHGVRENDGEKKQFTNEEERSKEMHRQHGISSYAPPLYCVEKNSQSYGIIHPSLPPKIAPPLRDGPPTVQADAFTLDNQQGFSIFPSELNVHSQSSGFLVAKPGSQNKNDRVYVIDNVPATFLIADKGGSSSQDRN